MIFGYVLAGVVGAIVYVISGRLKPVSRISVSVLTFVVLSVATTFLVAQIGDRPLEGSRIIDPSELATE